MEFGLDFKLAICARDHRYRKVFWPCGLAIGRPFVMADLLVKKNCQDVVFQLFQTVMLGVGFVP